MPYVVGPACVKCKYGDCVEACPVDAFHEGSDMLYINPEECIDCDACVPVCPVSAITSGDDADAEWAEKNAGFNFTDENQRVTKDSVEHGPDWDADKAT